MRVIYDPILRRMRSRDVPPPAAHSVGGGAVASTGSNNGTSQFITEGANGIVNIRWETDITAELHDMVKDDLGHVVTTAVATGTTDSLLLVGGDNLLLIGGDRLLLL